MPAEFLYGQLSLLIISEALDQLKEIETVDGNIDQTALEAKGYLLVFNTKKQIITMSVPIEDLLPQQQFPLSIFLR